MNSSAKFLIWIVVLVVVYYLVVYPILEHKRIIRWTKDKIFQILAPKLFEKSFDYKPERDSQLRSIQCYTVVIPKLKILAKILRTSYLNETKLLDERLWEQRKNDFDQIRRDVVDVRLSKEYAESEFYTALKAAINLKYDVPEKLTDYFSK